MPEMRFVKHRVDYLNHIARGSADAFAFYVCGDLPQHASYSTAAKYSFYSGLSLIQQALGPSNLVAVYMDVNRLDNLCRPAYVQMKADMRAGLFRRVFVMNTTDLLGSADSAQDMRLLYRELGGFDLLTYDQGAFKPVMLKGMGALS